MPYKCVKVSLDREKGIFETYNSLTGLNRIHLLKLLEKCVSLFVSLRFVTMFPKISSWSVS